MYSYQSLLIHFRDQLFQDFYNKQILFLRLSEHCQAGYILRHTIEDIDSVDDNKEFRILMYVEFALINKHSDIEAVSYTHLDVYKRQTVNHLHLIPFKGLFSSVLLLGRRE